MTQKKCVNFKHINVIKDIYVGDGTNARTMEEDSNEFPEIAGLHQGKRL